MGHLNLPSSKRNPNSRRFSLLDIITAFFFFIVILFFVLVFTPLGDPLAASGRQALMLSNSADPKHRERIIASLEAGKELMIESCGYDAVDHMPCEDPRRNSQLSREMNFYRERQCPKADESPLCLIPPPAGYKVSVRWPESLHKIWHDNMPHNKIADRKGHQGWMKIEGQYFIFPGGGTMFPDGAEQYIDKLGQHIPFNKGVVRTALDMGCGVASFGGYLLSKDILTLSFAPRDSHKSQIQFALERGIPAFVLMLGTRRLPFPAFSFDFMHCSRCLIPFTAYNATYFVEVDRLLRPGGYLVISGPPVQWDKQEKEWADLQSVARALCYELISVDGNTAIWKKPTGDSCFRSQNEFGLELCDESDDPSYGCQRLEGNFSSTCMEQPFHHEPLGTKLVDGISIRYFKLKRCVTRISSVKAETSVGVIPAWPARLIKAPPRTVLLKTGNAVFDADTRRWERRVSYYKKSLNIKLGTPSIRNVMDMNAFLGGFAAALVSDPVWVMNVIPSHSSSTLGVIYDRGLIGLYHDWCEPFSTYPRTYDLLHISGIESLIKSSASRNFRCNLLDLMVEMDRVIRPEGTVIIRDTPEVIDKAVHIAHAIRWTTSVHEKEPESHANEKILVATKTFWKLPSSA